MYAIVAGGGKVGYYRAKELVEQGNVVMEGDAAEASVLGDAGAERADVIVAVTGDDEDNLVISQVAKKRFQAPRAIARINNPKNEQIFRMLGIDATVSSTDVILGVLEQELPAHSIVPLLRLRHADVEIVETVLDENAPVVGRSIRDLRLPAECTIAVLIRNGSPVFPTGDTQPAARDRLNVVPTSP